VGEARFDVLETHGCWEQKCVVKGDAKYSQQGKGPCDVSASISVFYSDVLISRAVRVFAVLHAWIT
jgi:hypothetical protein